MSKRHSRCLKQSDLAMSSLAVDYARCRAVSECGHNLANIVCIENSDNSDRFMTFGRLQKTALLYRVFLGVTSTMLVTSYSLAA
jgi:hypothetical protein